jgi:hypothetical protein
LENPVTRERAVIVEVPWQNGLNRPEVGRSGLIRMRRAPIVPGRSFCFSSRTGSDEKDCSFGLRPLKKCRVVGGAFRRFGELVCTVVAAWRLGWLRLCGLGPQGGSDRVEVDKNGGPDGLEGGFSSSEVAARAPLVAVDDESEQPLDPRSGAV